MLQGWKRKVRELKQETYALYLAYKDRRTPWYARVCVAVVVAYAFSPLDLVPDFIPVLGYLDDLLLVPLGIVLARKLVPSTVLAECRVCAAEVMAQGKPVNRLAGAVIIAIWLLLAALGIFATVKFVGWL
jgi:uncharacterized membrane protein YkvA (DUF1232 family)